MIDSPILHMDDLDCPVENFVSLLRKFRRPLITERCTLVSYNSVKS